MNGRMHRRATFETAELPELEAREKYSNSGLGGRSSLPLVLRVVTSRENDPKRRPLAWSGVHLDARVEQLAKALDDGQADAFASLLMDRACVHGSRPRRRGGAGGSLDGHSRGFLDLPCLLCGFFQRAGHRSAGPGM